MLKLAVRHLRPDQVEELCEWFTHIQTVRRDEAMATLIDETVSHETAILIPNEGQPILVYAMEVDDPVQAQASAESGRHPIDAEHQAVLGAAVLGVPEQETVLDLRVDAKPVTSRPPAWPWPEH